MNSFPLQGLIRRLKTKAYSGIVEIANRKNPTAEAKANTASFIDQCWNEPSKKAFGD